MILILLVGVAALTWYLDKTYDNVTDLINNNTNSNIKKSRDGNYPDLGYDKQLAKNLPWGANRARRIGDWSSKNPNPIIDPQSGGENTRVQPMKRQPILPNQKSKFSKLVHNRENIEEYWRFDPYLGGRFQDIMPTHRRLAL
jgi:hypothetical protein